MLKILAFLLASACFAQDGLQIAGASVVRHVTTPDTVYRGRAIPAGAWVQVILHNPTDRTLPMPALVNGREPFQWVLAGEWSWSDSPRGIPAGGFGVLGFNGVTPQWRPGARITLETLRQPWSASFTLPEDDLTLTKISFYPRRGELVVHHRNDSPAPVTLQRVIVHSGAGFVRQNEANFALPPRATPAWEEDAAILSIGELPNQQVLIEAQFNNGMKRWAMLRAKDDSFDIGAGWLDTRSQNKANPLELPLFRSLLRRLHINLVHVQNEPNSDGKPFRRMATFSDVKRFSQPAEAASIHCADVVGEPQHSQLSPWEVFRRLKPYDTAAYPTCLTLSEDIGFGFYAGLSDSPHFDAYRVNAPHADDWTGYTRFGTPLVWGSPLESVGAMMRVLNQVNRPRPVAAWSQSTHYNWRSAMGGRRILDPTPEEMEMQAWQAVANGAQSLYWYSLESYSALRSPGLLVPTMEVGRRVRLLQELLEKGHANWHQRRELWDLNTVVSPAAAILFALDLDYAPDAESKTFRWKGVRALNAEFPLPHWLRGEGVRVLRVTASTVEPVAAAITPGGVRVKDSPERVGIYIATKDKQLQEKLKAALEALRRAEAAEAFDPANPSHLGQLAELLGYERSLR